MFTFNAVKHVALFERAPRTRESPAGSPPVRVHQVTEETISGIYVVQALGAGVDS